MVLALALFLQGTVFAMAPCGVTMAMDDRAPLQMTHPDGHNMHSHHVSGAPQTESDFVAIDHHNAPCYDGHDDCLQGGCHGPILVTAQPAYFSFTARLPALSMGDGGLSSPFLPLPVRPPIA